MYLATGNLPHLLNLRVTCFIKFHSYGVPCYTFINHILSPLPPHLSTTSSSSSPLPPLRRSKLEENLLFQKIVVSMDEEEGWLHEKITLVSSEEQVDTLAAVQVLRQRNSLVVVDTLLSWILYHILK